MMQLFMQIVCRVYIDCLSDTFLLNVEALSNWTSLIRLWQHTHVYYQEFYYIYLISLTNVAGVGSVFNDTRKVKVLSLPEMIKEKSKRISPLSFQVVREPLPFGISLILYCTFL